jgi:ABC-2 type transport system ATP-binding protein
LSAIEVCEVTKEYGSFKAVSEISLDIEKGETFGLLGPNGAGKTTLLGMIAGIITPTKGSIKLIGRDIAKEPIKVKSYISYSPQEGVVYDDLNAIENLRFFAGLYGLSAAETRKKVKELLDIVELSDFAKKRVKTYSGGMKKRLNLVAAIISDPEIILLDEPTTGLDPRIRRMMWDKILSLKKNGKTVVLATNYMEEADELSDRVAIMDKGQIVALDSPQKLKEILGPTTVVKVTVTEALPGLEKALSKFSEAGKISVAGSTFVLYAKDPDPLLPEVVEETIKKKGKVLSIQVAKPTLEDVFLKLTGRRITENES